MRVGWLQRIDVISRVVFPGMFALLNVVYWSYYLARANSVTMSDN